MLICKGQERARDDVSEPVIDKGGILLPARSGLLFAPCWALDLKGEVSVGATNLTLSLKLRLVEQQLLQMV